VFDVKPAPHLRILVEHNQIVTDELVMVPHGATGTIFDGWRRADLLAKVEAFTVARDKVPFDDAAWAARQRDTRLRAPGSRVGSKAVARDDVVVREQAKGDLVKDAGILVIRDQALPHCAIGITDIEPDAVTTIPHEPAPLQHGLTT